MNDIISILLLVGLVWLIWKMFVDKSAQSPAEPSPSPKEDSEARHVRNALQFAQEQHKFLSKKQREHAAWQQAYGQAKVNELDQLNGKQFEEYLAGLFRVQGYAAELTPVSGDYGADLILTRDGCRIAVQSKRHAGSIGVQAVQEALSGQAYYKCDSAWVVTTGSFTANAVHLAKKSGVILMDRTAVAKLIAQIKEETGSG